MEKGHGLQAGVNRKEEAQEIMSAILGEQVREKIRSNIIKHHVEIRELVVNKATCTPKNG